MEKYILSLDQGTTSSRAIIFDGSGSVRASAQSEFAQIYPHEGWVEHDPLSIYSSVAAVASEAIARCGIGRADVAAIGITNQRETTLVWDKRTGLPVYNAIVWQCRRTAERCGELCEKGYADMIYRKTGLPVDAYFSATKLEWILNNVEGARTRAENGELLFGTVDTYLMWKLSAGKIFATDYTNASRTMLFNIHTLEWDDELLKLFGIPRQMLPQAFPSGHLFGTTDAAEFGAEIPIAGVAGDQQAALFGQRCFEKGASKNTFGTGCFLLMNTGDTAVESRHGLVTTLAATTDGGGKRYALEGSVFIAGAVVQWLRDELRVISSAAESEKLAESVPDTLGVYFVPALVGLGAPYWDPYARGAIVGLTRGATRKHIVRAALEGICYRVYDVIEAMERDSGVPVTRIAADGGASANNFIMQFMSDIAAREVVRPEVVETTALGAAYLAGLTVGAYSEDTLRLRAGETVFKPKMREEKRVKLLKGWKKAIKMCKGE